jgi:hypothetical protein
LSKQASTSWLSSIRLQSTPWPGDDGAVVLPLVMVSISTRSGHHLVAVQSPFRRHRRLSCACY